MLTLKPKLRTTSAVNKKSEINRSSAVSADFVSKTYDEIKERKNVSKANRNVKVKIKTILVFLNKNS